MDLPERVNLPISLKDYPDIIDVRSPSEYEEDHIPGSINLPVLTDEERHEVGLLHTQSPYEARRLGATLITANVHRHLSTTLANHPRHFSPLLYCWRGNLRSNSMAIIFRAIGWRARILDQGYKSWRKWLMEDLDATFSKPKPELIVLGGLTGCGKTLLLHELEKQGAQILDLENIANHRGSILGTPLNSSQPNQKRFESLLWHQFQQFDPSRPVFTEAESNRIGKLQCPPSLWKRLGQARVVLLELPIEERVKLLTREYPHFIKDQSLLKETISGLTRLRGKERIQQWNEFIDQERWPEFLTSILEDHYDLVYRRPGSDESVYQSPEHSLNLASSNTVDYRKIAGELIKEHSKNIYQSK